ncbi:UNVERIFIED_CONTAM: head-tail adaptor protein, partial [Bacteroidetes bacterium 56_B9]
EVQRTSVKYFKSGGTTYVGELSQNGQKPLESFKDVKVFVIRSHPKPPFDNSMYVEFDGFEYKITEMEIDYASKEIIMIKAGRVS